MEKRESYTPLFSVRFRVGLPGRLAERLNAVGRNPTVLNGATEVQILYLSPGSLPQLAEGRVSNTR